jgi:hypothetical protein
MSHRTVAVAATLALAATAAPLSLAGAATSDATFKKQANAACASAGKKVQALPKLTDANERSVLKKETTILKAMVKKLKTIDAPSAKAAKFKQFVQVNQDAADLSDQTLKALADGDAGKAKSLAAKLEKAGDRSDALAKSLKLSDCAKDYSADD